MPWYAWLIMVVAIRVDRRRADDAARQRQQSRTHRRTTQTLAERNAQADAKDAQDR